MAASALLPIAPDDAGGGGSGARRTSRWPREPRSPLGGVPLLERAAFGGSLSSSGTPNACSSDFEDEDDDESFGSGSGSVRRLVPVVAEYRVPGAPQTASLLKSKVAIAAGWLLLCAGLATWCSRPAPPSAASLRASVRPDGGLQPADGAEGGDALLQAADFGVGSFWSLGRSAGGAAGPAKPAEHHTAEPMLAVVRPEYDCDRDVDRWQETWSLAKVKYCCPIRGIGCKALAGTVQLQHPNGVHRAHSAAAAAAAAASAPPLPRAAPMRAATAAGGGRGGDDVAAEIEHQVASAIQSALAAAIGGHPAAAATPSPPPVGPPPPLPPPPPPPEVEQDEASRCEETDGWMHEWSLERKRHCCLKKGVGCDKAAFQAINSDPPRDVSLAVKPGLDTESHAGSSMRQCEVGETPCPQKWRTEAKGGYFCKDNRGCRPWSAGVWEGCRDQCAIGHTPGATQLAAQPASNQTTYEGQNILLFCWSLCSQDYELDIIRAQLNKDAGIFACDETEVLTFYPVSLVGGKDMRVLASTVVPSVPVGRSKDGTAGNALQFMKAWEGIQQGGKWQSADWTIKVDPDAVILVDRLRMHLKPYLGQNVYVRNCDKPMSEGAMMFGALEAISSDAMHTYMGSEGRCFKEVPWQSWGEDLFMMRCLEHLGVGNVGDFSIIQDGVCKGMWCGSNWAAAFHPLKSAWAWENCWSQAVAAR